LLEKGVEQVPLVLGRLVLVEPPEEAVEQVSPVLEGPVQALKSRISALSSSALEIVKLQWERFWRSSLRR